MENRIDDILKNGYLEKYQNSIENYKHELLVIKAQNTDLNEEFYICKQNLLSKDVNKKNANALDANLTEQKNNLTQRIHLSEHTFQTLLKMYDDLKLLIDHVNKSTSTHQRPLLIQQIEQEEKSKNILINSIQNHRKSTIPTKTANKLPIIINKLALRPQVQLQQQQQPNKQLQFDDFILDTKLEFNTHDTINQENEDISSDMCVMPQRNKSLYKMESLLDLEVRLTPYDIVEQVKNELEKYKITMTDFSKYILGIQRQTAYGLIRLPRLWNEINAPTKGHYKRMYSWLIDPHRLDKLPHKVSDEQLKPSARLTNTGNLPGTTKPITTSQISVIKDLTDFYLSKITDMDAEYIENNITTADIIKCLNEFLEKHKIPRIYISNAFTRKSQSRLCDIINHPKSWHEQPKSIKREFKAIYMWLNDHNCNLSVIRNFYLNKNIKYRLRLTREQRELLKNFFVKQKYPAHEDLIMLSKQTNIDYKMIYRWFATKRVQNKINKQSLVFNELLMNNVSGRGNDVATMNVPLLDVITDEQLEALNEVYESTHYPDAELVEKLSDGLGGLNVDTINQWFSEKRGDINDDDDDEEMMYDDEDGGSAETEGDECNYDYDDDNASPKTKNPDTDENND